MPAAQLLDEQVSLERYWNYLRRQLYVMDTYVTPRNRLVNHSMLGLHTYLSWAFVLPCLTGASVPSFCADLSAHTAGAKPSTHAS